mgnify:CR=1 FL=1
MAKVIGVIGESGAGKTTSMRNLNPEETFYIDCDKKGLSWKGWKKQYIEGKNYFRGDVPTNVMQCLKAINGNEKYKDFKTVIVDTLNGIMVAEEMRNVKVAGYGKWTDLASYIYEIVDFALSMRDDLTVIFICILVPATGKLCQYADGDRRETKISVCTSLAYAKRGVDSKRGSK